MKEKNVMGLNRRLSSRPSLTLIPALTPRCSYFNEYIFREQVNNPYKSMDTIIIRSKKWTTLLVSFLGDSSMVAFDDEKDYKFILQVEQLAHCFIESELCRFCQNLSPLSESYKIIFIMVNATAGWSMGTICPLSSILRRCKFSNVCQYPLGAVPSRLLESWYQLNRSAWENLAAFSQGKLIRNFSLPMWLHIISSIPLKKSIVGLVGWERTLTSSGTTPRPSCPAKALN